jgi:DNA-binding MarR family transcriptional regulator
MPPITLQSHFKKAEESPGFLLWKAANRLQKLHAKCLAGLDVTPTQFSFMTCLVYLHQGSLVTPSHIVSHTGMDKMMVSDLVKTLEKKKLLKRDPNPQDGRSFFIIPTSLCVKKTNRAVRKIENFDRKFFMSVRDLTTFQNNLIALISPPTTTKRNLRSRES